jgi:hypothetical protein
LKLFSANFRNVYIPKPLLFVANMPLLLEDTELGPHGGIRWISRKVVPYFVGRSTAKPIEYVHDEALATAESRMTC